MASKRERFFAWQTKAFLLAGKQEDCITAVHQAFELVSKFHYGNECWLRRNEALAVAALGNKEAAINLLSSIWAKRKEWFLAWDMAKIAFANANATLAWAWCVKAVALPGDAVLRVGLYKLMGDVLMQKDDVKAALQHYELVDLIRDENNWAKDSFVTTVLVENNVNTGSLGSSVAVLDVLKNYWKEAIVSQSPNYQGVVSSMLPHGKAGFIKAADGKSYYFQLRDVKAKDRNQITLASEACFSLVEGFDKVKNRVVWNAVDLVVSY